jgi:hypothetical protein
MITMEVPENDIIPKRGDRLASPKTLYFILSATRIKRRDPSAAPKYKLRVAKAQELEMTLRQKLMWSAIRRGGSVLIRFQWNSRKKKTRSFEDLMRGERHG